MEYGLIGEKLGHSFSEIIHREFGEYDYRLHEIPRGELDAFMAARDFRGINVTIPYKKDVMPCLDYTDPAAEKIGAVNTVVNRDGKLYIAVHSGQAFFDIGKGTENPGQLRQRYAREMKWFTDMVDVFRSE